MYVFLCCRFDPLLRALHHCSYPNFQYHRDAALNSILAFRIFLNNFTQNYFRIHAQFVAWRPALCALFFSCVGPAVERHGIYFC